jgi:Acyl-CoA thioesterase C-terminal domain/Acyl-CoA thioesterase N-terminal domain
MEAFFTPDGDAFTATELTRGPWDPGSQHAGPPSALIGRALERCEPREDMRIARVTFDILRPVPIATLRVDARLVRPGRSVELLEATLRDEAGTDLVRATAWRIRTSDAGVDAHEEPPPPGPEDGAHRPFFPTGHDVGYHTAMEYRFISGGFLEPGPATVWMRTRVPIVEGEEPTPLQRVLVAADSGNGVSAALDWRDHLFINCDLTVHLARHPADEWVCLDAVTQPEPDGVGIADTALYDTRGKIGRAVQSLLVAKRG